MYNPEYGIDPYGQETYETEEERRRRLAAEAEANMPVKQTITYDPKTGAQKVKIEGGASNLTSANPATPTVSGPVNPDDTYKRMIQAESGGRQFNAQGGVLTSPKGAMGVGQVMPATAMQPGYGVTNIFDLAEQRGVAVPSRDTAGAQQLLGNEQLNREFGQNYYNAMNQRFPQDPNAAVAAYNAGPGRVGQNMQANAGQLNTAQLPNETQAYIQKVMGRMPQQAQAQQPQPIINDQGQVVGQETPAQMVAGAQANAPIAQGPVAPETQPQMVQTQAPAPQQPGPVGEQMGPSTQFMSQPGWIERFKSAQGDIGTMSSMLADPNLPKGAQMEIAASMADQMRFQKMEAEKREQYTRGIETGNFRQMERDERKAGTGEGSWLRYFMYGLMGSPNAAIEKQRLMPELYAKPEYITMTDNQTRAVVFKDDNGNILRGTTADGRTLTKAELIENARTGLGKGTSLSAEVYVDKDTGQRYRSGYDASGNTAMVNVQGGAAFRGDPKNLEVQSIGTAVAKAEGTKAVELRYTGPIAYTKAGADFAGEFNAKYGTNIGYQSQRPGAPLVDLNTGKPVVPNSNGTITATTSTGATTTAGGASSTAGKTPADIQGEFEANKKNRESQAKNINEAKKILPFVNDIKKLVDQSTGSGIGSLVDSAGNWFGYSTEGAKAIAAIKPLANKILMSVERFEGPQSDLDVKSYKEAAGQLADPKIPADQKQAAFATIIEIMKRNAPELDWSSIENPNKNSEIMTKADEIISKGKKK